MEEIKDFYLYNKGILKEKRFNLGSQSCLYNT